MGSKVTLYLNTFSNQSAITVFSFTAARETGEALAKQGRKHPHAPQSHPPEASDGSSSRSKTPTGRDSFRHLTVPTGLVVRARDIE